MRTNVRTAALIYGAIYAVFLGALMFSAPFLPDQLAAHFGPGGKPDGWMSATSHLIFMSVFGTIYSLGTVMISLLLRYLPASSLNIPNREYWLSPLHAGETRNYILSRSLWFGCWVLVFMIGVHFVVFAANRQVPPQLPLLPLMLLAGTFLGGIVVWFISLWRYFRRPPAISPSTV